MKPSLTQTCLVAALIGLLPAFASADHERSRNRHGANQVNRLGGSPYHGSPSYKSPSYGHGDRSYPPHELENAIRGLYLTYLGREPEPSGLRGWMDHHYHRGGSLDEIRIGIMSSPECFTRNQNDPAQYIEFLILQLTGRYPDAHELRTWVSRFYIYRGNLNYFCRDLVNNVR